MNFSMETNGLVSDFEILQDQDEDTTLIAAQFFSDTFSSVSLDAFNNGTSYSLYAR